MVAVVLAEDKYTTKYDNIDLDTILASDRLLKNYVNCLLEKGSCTPDGKELKGERFEISLIIIILFFARFFYSNISNVTSKHNSRNVKSKNIEIKKKYDSVEA